MTHSMTALGESLLRISPDSHVLFVSNVERKINVLDSPGLGPESVGAGRRVGGNNDPIRMSGLKSTSK